MNKTDTLKKLIRNEIKSVIAEGTRALIGIEQPNGKIMSVYNHYDGYPQHAGKILDKYYNNARKVAELIKYGRFGISFLDKSMKGGDDHSFKDPKKGETIFYGRDRGERDYMVSKASNRDKLKWDMGTEYAYIWSQKEKKWYYKSKYSNPQDWTEL